MSNAHAPVDESIDNQTDADSAPDPTSIPAAATTNTGYTYRCPICGTEYRNELIARIHITRAEDSDHDHHNGLMPETDITVVDEAGSVVGSVTRHPNELNPTTLSTDDFPEKISEPNRHVLTVAAHHPQETTRTTIADYVCSRLEDFEDVDAPAYRTVCSLLNRFYRPHVGGPGADEDETLDDLKPKQQAIIIARIVNPDASLSAIAKMVGVANSYPSQVLERASHVLNRINSKQDESDDSIAIRSELSDAAILTLREQGLIDDVEVSFDLPQDTDDNQTDNSETEEPSLTNETQDDNWGSPVDQNDVMTAAPDSQIDTSTTTGSSTATEQVDLTGDTTGQSGPATTETADDDATDSVFLQGNELAELQENVNFLRRAIDRIAEPTTETDLLAAVLEQIDQQLQQPTKES